MTPASLEGETGLFVLSTLITHTLARITMSLLTFYFYPNVFIGTKAIFHVFAVEVLKKKQVNSLTNENYL